MYASTYLCAVNSDPYGQLGVVFEMLERHICGGRGGREEGDGGGGGREVRGGGRRGETRPSLKCGQGRQCHLHTHCTIGGACLSQE